MPFDDIPYFSYITNDEVTPPSEIAFLANDWCNQSRRAGMIEQSKNGVRALQMPVDNLVSNWAHMVMASLASALKAWFSLLLPEKGRWSAKHKAEKQTLLKMEFSTFVNAFARVPRQIVRTGRRISYCLLRWNP